MACLNFAIYMQLAVYTKDMYMRMRFNRVHVLCTKIDYESAPVFAIQVCMTEYC